MTLDVVHTTPPYAAVAQLWRLRTAQPPATASHQALQGQPSSTVVASSVKSGLPCARSQPTHLHDVCCQLSCPMLPVFLQILHVCGHVGWQQQSAYRLWQQRDMLHVGHSTAHSGRQREHPTSGGSGHSNGMITVSQTPLPGMRTCEDSLHSTAYTVAALALLQCATAYRVNEAHQPRQCGNCNIAPQKYAASAACGSPVVNSRIGAPDSLTWPPPSQMPRSPS
jgi:hypothetical protein